MKNLFKEKKAITLIALIITIVVLIILAGVLINISLGNNGLINKAKTAKEMYTNAQAQEELDIAKMTNNIDGYVGGERNGITSQQYNDLLKRIEKLEDKTNYHFNEDPVIFVGKNMTTDGNNTIWFTNTNSYMTRNYNSDYFSYDATKGFICKKEGWYLINMYGHTSAEGYDANLNLKINDKIYTLEGRWPVIGQINAWTMMYLSENDILNGNYQNGSYGSNHRFYCNVYSFN